MSSPPPPSTRKSSEGKKNTPPTSIVTRNGARKAKIQTRAMASGVKPSTTVLAAKKKAQQRKKHSGNTVLKDQLQIAMESKSKVKGPTGFVTEPRMAEHKCLWDDKYPECPERLTSVIARCNELKLIEQCKQLTPRPATKEELITLHSPSVYEMLAKTNGSDDVGMLEEISSRYDAVYIHPSTHELALLAAGSTIDMVTSIVNRDFQNGAAFVRPPGHHAMRAEPCGYCFYNNVALAARHAIDKLGVERVLIVDWDVHHGQATQQMFYDDPRVVYFSIHRYEHGSFWPNLRQSDFHYIGTGPGLGYNFNVPLNKTGMTNSDYLAVWMQLLMPMVFEFTPKLIVVSAGYDSAIGDEKGEMEVTPACYATLLHLLMAACPSVCVVLEGGYCLPSLAEGAALTLRTLLGHAPPRLTASPPPSDEIRETILNCIYAHKPYWKCYNYQKTYSIDTTVPNVCDGEKEKHVVKVKWLGDETRPQIFATRDCYPVQDDTTKRDILTKLHTLSIMTDLWIPRHQVCYVYDQAMLKHRNICEPGHVECPERIMRIHERHRDFGLLKRVHQITGRRATDEEILAVHTAKHLDRLKDLSTTKLRNLNQQKNSFDSVYFHPDSLESAATAVGCVLEAVDSVILGHSQSAVCIVRPPGHHADDEVPSGFCLLNNAVCAGRHAINVHGVSRVLLVDWDVHHGNGTQRLTYNDHEILYISLHRYDNGSFFPHSNDADYTAVGEGLGEGYNVNIPWNKRGMGDAEYLAAFSQVVLPVAYEYDPELVIVSAGFDACVGDPIGGCKVTPECYGRLTNLLRGLAGGRIILCLEGGYNVTSISYAMTMCTKALLGDAININYVQKHSIHWSAIETINNVIKVQKKYWKSLKFQLALPIENVLENPLPSRGLIENLECSLESKMANLKVECSDGIHCDTDDQETFDDQKATLSTETQGSVSKRTDDHKARSTDAPDDQKATSTETLDDQKATLSTKSQGSVSRRTDVQKATRTKTPDDQKATFSTEPQDSQSKKTLVDYLSENIQAIVNEEMFAVIPLNWCPHLDGFYDVPTEVKFEMGTPCVQCGNTDENWVCLHCYVVACARSINGHMQSHYLSRSHPLSLSLSDLSVWCSACDAYVDNALLYDAKNNAHRCKFGEDMPWCYPTDTIQMN